MTPRTVLRVARPTDRLADVVQFYTEGLGLARLDTFSDHAGFDGVMLGTPGGLYHLEFTHHRGHDAGRAPTRDHLLVFYFPGAVEWQSAVSQMLSAGYLPVEPINPYWAHQGVTFEDPDGYRVVLQHDAWPASDPVSSAATRVSPR